MNCAFVRPSLLTGDSENHTLKHGHVCLNTHSLGQLIMYCTLYKIIMVQIH